MPSLTQVHRDATSRSLEFPPGFEEDNPTASDLVRRLLVLDPLKRLTFLPKPNAVVKCVQEHPFFSALSWDDLLAK